MNKLPILLVDTSYVSFYRLFSTMTWYKFSHPKEDIPEICHWINNDEYMTKYRKMYLNEVDKIRIKYDISYKNTLFALDCPRDEIWRTMIFPDYKGQRQEKYAKKTWTGGPVLGYSHRELIHTLADEHGFKVMRMANAEGDDIIACIKKHIRTYNPTQKIVIITNDNDFLQLGDEHTTLINLKQKLLCERSSSGCFKRDLQIKIMCGDKADNIPKCFKRCGVKTANKFYDNPALLQRQFEKEPGSKEQYELNTKLIDFNCIPQQFYDKIISHYTGLMER
jgi:5'-3' exonuclease